MPLQVFLNYLNILQLPLLAISTVAEGSSSLPVTGNLLFAALVFYSLFVPHSLSFLLILSFSFSASLTPLSSYPLLSQMSVLAPGHIPDAKDARFGA